MTDQTTPHSPLVLKFCPTCGTALPDAAKFCPGCGFSIAAFSSGAVATAQAPTSLPSAKSSARSLTMKQLGGVALLAIGIWIPVSLARDYLTGPVPTKTFSQIQRERGGAPANDESTPAAADAPELREPRLAQLLAAAKAAPNDFSAQQAAAEALVNQIRSTETPSAGLVLEAIEVLSGILQQRPTDPDALIAMADINFNQQVIQKAVEYYERYLKVSPADMSAKARYGSALSMMGKFEEGIRELKTVLEKEPKNFQAGAYLAITYAQMGEQELALQTGESALKNAPSPDARTRFGKFLDEIRSEPVSKKAAEEQSAKRGTQPMQTAKSAAPSAPQVNDDSLLPITQYITTNDIAGRKFVGASRNGTVVELYFREFPMAGMPPFVKDKFVNSIKMRATGITGVTALKFIDRDSGEVMAESKLGQ